MSYFSSAVISVAFEYLDNLNNSSPVDLTKVNFWTKMDILLAGKLEPVDMNFFVSPAIQILAKLEQKIVRQQRCLGY